MSICGEAELYVDEGGLGSFRGLLFINDETRVFHIGRIWCLNEFSPAEAAAGFVFLFFFSLIINVWIKLYFIIIL